MRHAGSSYAYSSAPFQVQGHGVSEGVEGGCPLVFHPEVGSPVVITAGSSPVYIGGHPRSWVGNPNPFILEPGKSARAVLLSKGDIFSSSEWEVEPVQ
jgi:hypothetical protein